MSSVILNCNFFFLAWDKLFKTLIDKASADVLRFKMVSGNQMLPNTFPASLKPLREPLRLGTWRTLLKYTLPQKQNG